VGSAKPQSSARQYRMESQPNTTRSPRRGRSVRFFIDRRVGASEAHCGSETLISSSMGPSREPRANQSSSGVEDGISRPGFMILAGSSPCLMAETPSHPPGKYQRLAMACARSDCVVMRKCCTVLDERLLDGTLDLKILLHLHVLAVGGSRT